MAKASKPPSSIFYGWWVVAACFLIAVYTFGVVSYGFTAVFQPIATEFNWSYTTVSLASSLATWKSVCFLPSSAYYSTVTACAKFFFSVVLSPV